MSTPADKTHYLTLDELCPAVDLASFWHTTEDRWYQYRIPGHHLLLLEAGKAEARTPNGQFQAGAGDLLCFRPAELNEYGTFGRTLFYQAHISFGPPPRESLTPWLDELGPLPVKISTGKHFDALRQLFETLCLELNQSGATHRLRVQGAVFELLAQVAELCAARTEKSASSPARLDSWQRLRLRLGSQLDTEVRIDEMAARTGLSVDHFIRQFKQRFGMAPKAYRTYTKMREAARLLREGGHSIKSIAYTLGFSDTKSFSRTFKRHLRVIPSDFQAGLAGPALDTLATRERLYPVNQHVIPPHAGPNWLHKWRVRG